MQPVGNRDLIRAINRSAVLNSVKANAPIARAEIARRTGLSAATVSGITADLIADQIIFEKEAGDSRGGRRPILLAINPQGGYVVGIKLTESEAIGALTDLEASVLARRSARLSGRTPEKVVASLAQLVDQLLTRGGVPRQRLLGVGVGLAGIVDGKLGLLRQSPFFGWRELPLGKMLESSLKVPVYIENDVNALTLAERWFGAGQGVDDFLTVTIGRGVGLGIVASGRFYRGSHGGAGEFGHIVIDPEGELCDCGKRGCLETIVGDPGMLRMAADMKIRASSAGKLVKLASEGHPGAQGIFERSGRALGQSLANLINIFDPQLIIISGEGTRAGQWLFGPMQQALDLHVMPGLAGHAELRIDPWDDDAWARGAASVVLRELFESPVHRLPAGVAA